MKVSKEGGPTTTIVTVTGQLPAGLAVDDTSVYWTDWTDSIQGSVFKFSPK